jgi:hypothetical protein
LSKNTQGYLGVRVAARVRKIRVPAPF